MFVNKGVVQNHELNDLDINRNLLATAIYGARLRRHLEPWLVSKSRQPPTRGAGFDTLSDTQKTEETGELTSLRAAHGKYTAAKKSLIDSVDTERKDGRLRMTDEVYNELMGNLATLELRFVGLYTAKADLMNYLHRQLTGSRPRSESANHIIGAGEPGTGKTSLMKVVGSMMAKLSLIDVPTLESYASLGKTLENAVTGDEGERIKSAKLPAEIHEKLYTRVDAPTLFALRAASSDTSAKRPVPQVYDAGKFDSPFDGGRMAAFMRAVFRTLGSVMIIDEAYTLKNSRFTDVVDQLVALITQLGTQWSTMLLGYGPAMAEFFDVSNIGLRRRYNATFIFESFTASELVTILIQNAILADNVVFADNASQVEAVADAETAEDPVVSSTIFAVLTSAYNEMGPYAMRKSGRRVNVFGSDNAGAVEKLFGALGVSAQTKYKDEPLMTLMTPSDVRGQMESGTVFGVFTDEQAAAEKLKQANQNAPFAQVEDDDDNKPPRRP